MKFNINVPHYICMFIIILIIKTEELEHTLAVGGKTNKTLSYRTTGDVEQNIIFNEMQHSHGYVDEVFFI